MELNKVTLIEQVTLFMNDIQINSPEKGSHEWYLSNNLNRFRQSISVASTGNEIKIATQILMRYCVESMNWDTEIYKRCSTITKLGLRLAKILDQQDGE